MAEDNKIKYSDIIEPDDSIEKLVKQLGELNQSYETMVNAIRAGADRIVHSNQLVELQVKGVRLLMKQQYLHQGLKELKMSLN